MGGELLFEGFDGAAISNINLTFVEDIVRQSGSPKLDKLISSGTNTLSSTNWVLLGGAFLLNSIV